MPAYTDPKTLGQQLRELREAADLSTRDVGRQMHQRTGAAVHGVSVTHIEQGRHAGTQIERARMYANIYGHEFDAFLYDPKAEAARLMSLDVATIVDQLNAMDDDDAALIRRIVDVWPRLAPAIQATLRAQVGAWEALEG